MAKLKVQAQHLQSGDIVGSGEVVRSVFNTIRTPIGKVNVSLSKSVKDVNGQYLDTSFRNSIWGKYTMIGVERKE